MKKINTQIRRQKRTRAKILGTAIRPRCSVFRSGRHMYAQLIDDEAGRTLLALSDRALPKAAKKGKAVQIAALVGETLAGQALKRNITAVVFDRGAYLYHGRVRALAEGARKGGLKF